MTIAEWDATLLATERQSKNGFYFFHIRNDLGHVIYEARVDAIGIKQIEVHKSLDEVYARVLELLKENPNHGYWWA